MAFETICCAVDFSESSHAALEEAATLASRVGAQLTIVHVHGEVPTLATDLVVTPSAFLEAAAKELREQLEVLRRDAEARTGRPVRCAVLGGHAADELVRYARKQNVDLLVLGSHGRTGVWRLALGSIAERVLRHAPCPVLVVAAKARERASENVPELGQYAEV
jgi:universal stress protein A